MHTQNQLSNDARPLAVTAKWLILSFFLVTVGNVQAQRIQLQIQAGVNASEARIKDSDAGYLSRETITFFDTLPVQLGVGVKIKVFRNFYVRLDGNYKAYRTFFEVEESMGGVSSYVLGNLYNEKYSYSLLPEYQHTFLQGKRIEFPVFGFAGPVFSFEKGNNYSYNDVIDGGSAVFLNAVKPDVQTGWSLGLGCNPKWKRWGLLLEGRLLRIGYQEESIIPGRIGYQHFTFMSGITYDLF
ncbi:MAG TPA: hypothetical protein PLO67_12800 [Saprospiraceae bacterium]|nr:hypothetical protein [Saprospiraceae bacterium]HPI08647.1 hypothetical protein [Saprospiraceae bacterium]